MWVLDLYVCCHLSVYAPKIHSKEIPLTFFPSDVVGAWIHLQPWASSLGLGGIPFTHIWSSRWGNSENLPTTTTKDDLKDIGRQDLDRGRYLFELEKMCIRGFSLQESFINSAVRAVKCEIKPFDQCRHTECSLLHIPPKVRRKLLCSRHQWRIMVIGLCHYPLLTGQLVIAWLHHLDIENTRIYFLWPKLLYH